MLRYAAVSHNFAFSAAHHPGHLRASRSGSKGNTNTAMVRVKVATCVQPQICDDIDSPRMCKAKAIAAVVSGPKAPTELKKCLYCVLFGRGVVPLRIVAAALLRH